MAQQRDEYLTKTIQYGEGTMTLYSLDGLTWSSRPAELTVIKERHEQQRMVLMGKKEDQEEGSEGGIKFGGTPKPKRDDDGQEADGDEPFVLGDEEEDDVEELSVSARKIEDKKEKPAAKLASKKAIAKPKASAKPEKAKKIVVPKAKPAKKAVAKPAKKKKAKK